MKSLRFMALSLATAGLVGTAALADSSTPQNNSSQANATAQKSQQAPEGFVLYQEDVVWVTANEPQNHFLRAHELLQAQKPKAAAGELRVAATYLDMEATRGQSVQDQRLKDAANDLRQQADRIAQQKDGSKVDQKQLMQSFAQANLALATNLQAIAKKELQNQKRVMAGHDLLSAADSLSAAYVWSDEKPQQQASTAIDTARRAADQLLGPSASGNQASQSEDRAQPAGAKMNQGGQSSNTDPSAAIDQLGTAIQSAHLGQSSQDNQSKTSK